MSKTQSKPKPRRMVKKADYTIMNIAKADAVVGESEYASLRGTTKTKGLFNQPIDLNDLIWGVKREPGLFRVTYGVAVDVWDNGFTIKNLDNEKDQDFDKQVKQALDDLKAKAFLIRLTALERLFGWAILVLGAEDSAEQLKQEISGTPKIEDLEVYAGDYHVTDVTEDNSGMPEIYKVTSGSKKGALEIHHSRVCHAATRLFLHQYKGLSVAELVYDDNLSLRYIRWATALGMIRMGFGVADVEIKGADKKKVNEFIDSRPFDDLTQLKHFVHDEDKKLEFKGIGGQAFDPEKFTVASRESISTGTGIPEPMMRGAQAGALTGSEVNERAYFKMISDQQSLFEPVLRRLIDKIMAGIMGEGKVPKYKVEWAPAFELTEREKVDVELTRIRTLVESTTFRSVNEVRKIDNLPPVPGGDVILGISKSQPQALGGLPPFIPGVDEVPEAEQNLATELKRIFEGVKSNAMKKEDGLLAAELVIDEHINRMKKTVKLKIETKVGKPIADVSPEQERYFVGLKKRYMQDFKRICEDAGL